MRRTIKTTKKNIVDKENNTYYSLLEIPSQTYNSTIENS